MDSSITAGSSLWYAVHTHLHQENRTEANLRAWNVETFYPKIKHQRRNEFSGAVSHVTRPFFPRYLFARFEVETLLHKVWFTRGVDRVVSFGGNPSPVDDDVIEFFRGRADPDGFIKLGKELMPGDRVVMKGGVLDNLVGIFEREMNASDRVMILLQTIKYQGHVIVARESIRKIAANQVD